MNKDYVHDLLIIERDCINRIHNEIEKELRGKGDPDEFKEGMMFLIDERLRYVRRVKTSEKSE